MDESRTCTKCDTLKPLEQFSRAPRGKYGRKATCKACDAARAASVYMASPRQPGPRQEPHAPDAEKACTKCGLTKVVADFSLSRAATDKHNAVYRSHCKACQSERAMRWFADNPERAFENRRRFSLEKNYGITPAEYEKLLRAQGRACAICGKEESSIHGSTGKRFRLSVDHCHKSNKVRGLLCQRCNRALGLFGDDATLLRKAISYLLRNGAE